jgi:uncharacterized protein involved in response to NO
LLGGTLDLRVQAVALNMALKPLHTPPESTGLKPIRITPKKPPPPTDMTWRRGLLLAAPHRLAFFSGAVMMAIIALWWTAILLARTTDQQITWNLAPGTAHAMLMSLGFMPLFFVGFLFTAGPKWMAVAELPTRTLLPFVVITLLGWVVCLIGLHTSAALGAAGLALVAAAWTGLTWKFGALWRASRATDKAHVNVVLAACLLGVLALWGITAGFALQDNSVVRSLTQAALWMFVAPVFAAVSHRMIPFFSTSALPVLDAWRPLWLLHSMVAILMFEGVMAGVDVWLWPAPTALRWIQVAIEVPVAVLMIWLAVRWGLVQSLKIRLLAMLHGGFLWLGIALALQAVSHSVMALSQDQQSLGLAPTHAMTMGYLGATLLAMGTRVASGHSGRPLAADNMAWTIYWVLQTAVVLRVLAALWPPHWPALSHWPLVVTAMVWSVAVCGWALRYGSWFGRPRLDGRAG